MPDYREAIQPIVIELGKVKRRKIRDLKCGQGELVGEVADALSTVRAKLGAEAEGRSLVPVVLVYRRKGKKRGRGMPFFPW